MASSPITSWEIEGEKVEVLTDFLFLGSKISADDDCSHEIRRHLLLGRKAMTNLDSVLKSRDITLPAKVGIVKAMVFPVFTYRLWGLDGKEGRMLKNRCLQTVVLEKTPENQLDSKEIKPGNCKGNQPWIFSGRTYAETPVFCSYDVNSWLTGKVPEAGKDRGQKQKRASQDEMPGWHHWCNGHELGRTSGDGEGQQDLVCRSPWDCKKSDPTACLNNNNNNTWNWYNIVNELYSNNFFSQ